MALIDHIDGENRDVYLHSDTVTMPTIHPIDIYKEMRSFRRLEDDLKKYFLFMSAHGNDPKGSGKFTERYVKLLQGTRIIPYDVDHELTIIGTMITDDGQEGVACFDRALLSPGTTVDINYVPPQVEIIAVATGSGVTEQDKQDIAGLSANQVWDEIVADHQTAGTTGADLGQLHKAHFNRRSWNKVADTITIYADDGITPLYVFDTNDDMSEISPQ